MREVGVAPCFVSIVSSSYIAILNIVVQVEV